MMSFNDDNMRYYIGTRKAYDRYDRENKLDPNGCYFITDTGELIFEGENYNHVLIFYTGSLPESPTQYKIYLSLETMAANIWNGNRWCTIFGPASASFISSNPANLPTTRNVSGEVVVNYTERLLIETMDDLITLKTFKYTPDSNLFTITIGNNVRNISLNSIGRNLTLNEDGYTIELRDVNDNIIDSKRLYPCNLISGEFNIDTLTIDFHYSDDTPIISIPIDRIFNLMLSENTMSMKVSISPDDRSFLSMDVKISEDSNNELKLYPDGLYASWTRFINKVDEPNAVLEVDEIGYAKAQYSIVDSLTSPDNKNIVTESGVNRELNEVLDSYWKKADTWTEIQEVFKSLRVCSANT